MYFSTRIPVLVMSNFCTLHCVVLYLEFQSLNESLTQLIINTYQASYHDA